LKGVGKMVIRTAEDMEELLHNRIEAMEDLNCEELEECVEAFMLTFGTIYAMEILKDKAKVCYADSQYVARSRQLFDDGFSLATKMLERIDELTLRDDAAE
jgi:hypothetical protein